MRVMVTGSRNWDDWHIMKMAMYRYPGNQPVLADGSCPTGTVLVEGDCPTGGDAMARDIALLYGWHYTERHLANWRKYGRAAGPLRNKEMVKAGADVCLAFIKGNSRGASGCADLAEKAGIPVERFYAR